MEINIKRNVVDSVFTNLFSDKKYLLELYKTLEKNNVDVKEEDIKILTLQNIIIDSLYNDLGFQVKDELIILMEAQVTYTKNIVIRMLMYLSKTIEEYIRQNNKDNSISELYQSKFVVLPKIKLYTVYTGERKMQDHDINLSDLMVKNSIISDIQLKVRVICSQDKSNILGQYIIFTDILREQKSIFGLTKEAIRNAIDICINEDILREYLTSRKMEVEEVIASYMTQEEATVMYGNSMMTKGIEQGIEQGMEMGIEQGIEQLIYVYIDELNMKKEDAVQRISSKFNLPLSVAREYVEKYWK